MYSHTPVLLEEVIKYLNPQPGEIFIDGTLGGGGYTLEIAKLVGKTGKVIALDLDETAIKHAKLKTAREGLDNIKFYHANFKNFSEVIDKEFSQSPLRHLAGVVLDLGLSSAQLEDSTRGFSFQKDAPLSMAFGSLIDSRRTEAIVNFTPVRDLAKIIRDFGEEKFALSIARSIASARRVKPLTTTYDLVKAISQAVPASYKRARIHFATRTFQALRIATNEELKNLEIFLESLKAVLTSPARIVIVSFHSLEDRLVKQFFKKESRDCLCPPEIPVCVCGHQAWLKILTTKAIKPSVKEIESNPRARSAKLRAAHVI